MSRRKLIISILLFLLYEVAVWFGAAALASPANFLLVVFVLSALGLTVLIVYLLISRLTTPTAGAPAPQSTAAPAPAQDQPVVAPRAGADPDLDAITALLNEANNRLARSPTLASRRIRTSVYGLPLYLLGGPEGAGKTTTFLKAGLEPELLAGQVYRDANVLPTRLANFWFAGDALFAEALRDPCSARTRDGGKVCWTASREDRAVGSSRSSSPARSSRSCADSSCSFKSSPCSACPIPADLGISVAAFRSACESSASLSGTNFPVYVVFTKSDASPYFTEYFGRLTENEDQQILGCTLPAVTPSQRPAGEVFAEAETSRLADAFNSLYYSLAEKRTTMLARETTAAKKPSIYEYPREVKRIRDTLVQFLVDVFRPNPLQDRVRFSAVSISPGRGLCPCPR